MSSRTACAALAVGLLAGVAMADDEMTTTTEESLTIEGEVVRMEPGKTIVLRQSGGELVSYQLEPEVVLPSSVEVGTMVVLHREQPASRKVTKVTTTQVGPFTKRVEETTDELGEVQAQTTYTVKGIEPGRRIILVGPTGRVLNLGIDAESVMPVDISVGKHVVIETEEVGGSPVARRVVYTKKTVTTEEDE